MTNKKFKIAAMSMALTACVAAQPLIANAADEVDINSNEPAPQSEEGSSVSTSVAAASAGSSNTEVKDEDKRDMLAPDEHLSEYSKSQTDTDGNSTSKADITKDAHEQEREPEIDGTGDSGTGDSDGSNTGSGDGGNTGSGSGDGDTGTSDSDGTGNTDNTDNTGNTGNTDSTGGTGGTGGNTGSEKKEQNKIGDSTLTETPEQSSSVVTPTPGATPMPDTTKPSKVTPNPDGSSDIETPTLTPGTETTTTTASGKVNAESHTGEEISGDQIDLNKELGEKKPDWNTEEGKEFNGYKVSEVKPSDDGNSKTLTLTKTEHLEGKMGSEELAKFTNSTKKVNDDGTYDLVRTETYTDTDGQQRTRTTTLHVKDNEVTVDTTITLTVALEKNKHESDPVDVSKVVLPDITVTGSGQSFTIGHDKLAQLMNKTTPTTDANGNTIYTVTGDDGLTYTITETKGKYAAANLTNEEMFALLDHSSFALRNGEIYYTANGEDAKLSPAQTKALRRTLSYSVTAKKTETSEVKTDGKESEAETAAKTEARNNAVINALKQMGLSDEDAKAALAPGKGTFNETDHTFTYTLDGKTYTLNYIDPTSSEDPSKVTSKPDADGKTEIKDHTVTGTAFVQNGTVVQGGNGKISNTIGGVTFNSDGTVQVPDGAKATYDPVTNRLSGYTLGDTTYTFSYDTMSAEDAKAKYSYLANVPSGWTLDGFSADVTTVTWTATTKTTTELPGELSSGNGSAQKDETGDTYTVTIGTDKYTGLTYDDVTKTYTGKKDGSTVTIKVTDKTLDADKVKALLAAQYNDSITLTGVSDGTYTATYTDDAGTHTITYRAVTQDYQLQTVSSSTTIQQTSQKEFSDLVKETIEDKAKTLGPNQSLQLTGSTVITITKGADGKLRLNGGDFDNADFSDAAIKKQFYNEIVTKYASNNILYDKLTQDDIWNLLDKQQQYGDGSNADNHNKGYDSYFPEYGYENIVGSYPNGKTYGETYWYGSKPTYFGHLSLDAQVTIEGTDAAGKATTYDGVILSEGLQFEFGHKDEIAGVVKKEKYPDYSSSGEWYNKDELHHTGTEANKAKLDTSTIKEVDGQVWVWDETQSRYVSSSEQKLTYTYQDKDNTNAFRGKRFYKVLGSVAYDQRNTEGYLDAEAADKLVEELQNKEGKDKARKVAIKTADGIKYNVYANVTTLKAFGYMTATANTANSKNLNGWYPGSGVYSGSFNAGDYDLRVQGLKLVEGQVQGNYGINYSLNLSTITNASAASTHVNVTGDTAVKNKDGSGDYGTYNYTYQQEHNWTKDGSQGMEGTGEGHYTSFRQLLTSIFTGNGTGHEDSGNFSYTYRTEKDAELAPVSKVTKVDKTAHITYDRTTVESRDVLIPDTEIVHIDPDGGDDGGGDEIIDEKDPDAPVLPSTPELPPVQDARPDAPVLPSDPVLPPVQDARIDASALPQTGVNWLTAIGLALSGMTVMITGAFASLTGKS